MYEKENAEKLKELTGLEVKDLDQIGKFGMMLICRYQEINDCEESKEELKKKYKDMIEDEFEHLTDKTSERYKALSNADKRLSVIEKLLKDNKDYINAVGTAKKLKTEARIFEEVIGSLKRKEERDLHGPVISETKIEAMKERKLKQTNLF